MSRSTYTANVFITVTTGNAGSTDFVLNGKDLGTLGGDGLVQNWRLRKGQGTSPGGSEDRTWWSHCHG